MRTGGHSKKAENRSELAISPLRSPAWGWFFTLMAVLVMGGGGFWMFGIASDLQLETLKQQAEDLDTHAAALIETASKSSDEDEGNSLRATAEKMETTAGQLRDYVASHTTNETFRLKGRLVLQYGILPISLSLFLLGKRLRQDGPHRLLEKDNRRPVLYLRSFKDDHSEYIYGKYSTSTEESKFVKKLQHIGPVLAIGRPGEKLTQLGAARLYVSGSEWQKVAVQLMEQSQLIVIRAGTTAGILWELGRARQSVDSSRIAIYIPPNANYSTFRPKAEEQLKLELPANLHEHRLIVFNPEWKPIPSFALANPNIGFTRRRFFQIKNEMKALLSAFSVSKVKQGTHSSLLELLSKLEIETVRRPKFHLHWASWLVALIALLLIILFPSDLVKFFGGTEVLFPNHPDTAASLIEGFGLFTACLALSFIPYFAAPARRLLPNFVFISLVMIDLVFVGLRVPKATRELQDTRRLKDAKAELADSKRFEALIADWKLETASHAAQNDAADPIKTLIRRLDGFTPSVASPQTRRMAEQFSKSAKSMIPAAAALAAAQNKFEEKDSPDKLNSVADIDGQLSLLDGVITQLKTYQETRTNFLEQMSGILLAEIESMNETRANKQRIRMKNMMQRCHDLFALEDSIMGLRREMLVFLRDHLDEWKVNPSGDAEFSDTNEDHFRFMETTLNEDSKKYQSLSEQLATQ